MWSPERELVKKSAALAKDKYPNGYNKKQLIACSKEVYGGFGVTQTDHRITRPIRTMEDVSNMGNAMANIDGHYPVGMSGCYVVGINGGCGLDCPVFLEGECGVPAEMLPLEGEDLELYNSLY